MNRPHHSMAQTLLRNRMKRIKDTVEFYSVDRSPQEIVEHQVRKFNVEWQRALSKHEFYRKWRVKYDLPGAIETVSDLDNFPVLKREHIVEGQKLIEKDLESFYYTYSGGTSGPTLKFPTSKADADQAYLHAYLGRAWWGIEPCDKILMLWGHSHLFGDGLKKHVRKIKRRVADWVIRTERVSCYQLNRENVEQFIRIIIESDAKILISYASNLYKICQFLESHNISLLGKYLEKIIVTSETLTADDAALIKKHFKCEVIQEYGLAETGAVGYSKLQTHKVSVFWDGFVCRQSSNKTLLVSTLHKKLFPLFNYETDDVICVDQEFQGSILSLAKIEGKVRHVLRVRLAGEGVQEVSAVLFDHILKQHGGIFDVRYSQRGSVISVIVVPVADGSCDVRALHSAVIRDLSREIGHNVPIDSIEIAIGQEKKTIAGKRLVVEREAVC